MRRKILTKIEDLEIIAGEISKIKNVKAIYLFGSVTREESNVLSDIDICVFGNLNQKQQLEILKYSSDNLDISFFNKLPLIIQFRVFKEGKPLILKDNNFINNLKIKTIKYYLDFKHILNRYSQEVLGCIT